MKTMTLRGIDPVLSEKLMTTAKQKGKSINQFILDTIKTQLGLLKEKRHSGEHYDMDHLFGRWTDEEFQRIQNKINSERRIDPDIWQ
jgi:hypothetical protein